MGSLLLPIAVFMGVAALVGAVAYFLRSTKPTDTEDRLEILTGKKNPNSEKELNYEDIVRDGLSDQKSFFEKLANRLSKLKHLFEQADSPVRANGFFGMTGACAGLGLMGCWAAKAHIPVYPAIALITASFPLVWLLLRRRRRFKMFARQLPDAMELIARALRSGNSLNAGIHVVVTEMPAPVSSEFGIAFEEQNLGVQIDESLKNMLNRMPNLDLKFFVTAVVIQRKAGGDLAILLDKIGAIVRERFKIMGQVQALTGEGRISGIVLMGMTPILFIAVYFLNREYVMLLFSVPIGKQMIAAAAVLQALGALVIRKIVNIKI